MIFALAMYLLIIGVLFLFYFTLLNSMRHEAPYVPTGRRDLRKILEAAQIKPGEVFYDLGRGDGRAVRAAARLGARAIGFEQSSILVLWSRVIVWLQPRTPHHPVFVRGDYLKENLSPANVIFCYLMPKAMEHLKEKFAHDLKPGTRIVSRAFKIPGWTPQARLQVSRRTPPVYAYIKE